MQALAQKTALAWGAQNISAHTNGAFTGQISATMLNEFNAEFVIIGHSERRHYNHETDHLIAEKFVAAQAQAITPILCIGETHEEYEAGKTEQVVSRQLSTVIKHVGIDAFSQAVIAYEPVWAIGTGLAATPKQAQVVHEMIRMQLAEEDFDVAAKVRILYGGSVKPENAVQLFQEPDIDGGLIGGASLEADAFIKISHGFDASHRAVNDALSLATRLICAILNINFPILLNYLRITLC